MSSRKVIPKKKRFEIFKRDSFTCQYCGAKAPEVILELDHVDPVANGGSDDMLNLITACFDCNRGKSDRKLDDNSVILKQRDSLELLNEKRTQITMLMEWKTELLLMDDEQIEAVNEYFLKLTGYSMSASFKKLKLRPFLKKYGLSDLLEAIEVSCNTYYKAGTADEIQMALNKLGGVLYNRKLKKNNPLLFEKNMVRSYARSAFNYINEAECTSLIDNAYSHGHTDKDIKEIVRKCKSWSAFRTALEDIIGGNTTL